MQAIAAFGIFFLIILISILYSYLTKDNKDGWMNLSKRD